MKLLVVSVAQGWPEARKHGQRPWSFAWPASMVDTAMRGSEARVRASEGGAESERREWRSGARLRAGLGVCIQGVAACGKKVGARCPTWRTRGHMVEQVVGTGVCTLDPIFQHLRSIFGPRRKYENC